jgi:hypothetical protein
MKISKVSKVLNENYYIKEELGLNKGVYNIATRLVDVYVNTLSSNADKIVANLIKKGEHKEFVNHRLTKGYFQSQLNVNWVDAQLKLTLGDAMKLGASFDPSSEDPAMYIDIEIPHDSLKGNGVEFIKQLSAYDLIHRKLLTSIVHELTHAKEFTNRYPNKADLPSSAFLNNHTSQDEPNPDDISGFKEVIGRLAYFANESEINAKVAECATIIKNLPPNLSNEELLAKLRGSQPWGIMEFLTDIDLSKRKSQFIKAAKEKYGNPTQEDVNKLVGEFIKEALDGINTEVNKYAEISGQPMPNLQDNGFMKTLRMIASQGVKGDVFDILQKSIRQRGLYFRNKLYKTVGLAARSNKLHTAINSRV